MSSAEVAADEAPKSAHVLPTSTAIEDHEFEERHSLAARGQRIVIYSILLNFVLRAAEQAHAFPDLVMQLLFVCTAIYSLWGVVQICSGLYESQGKKLLLMALCFFPLINVITLVYLSVRTTRMLRAAGWTVGLLGARP